MELVQYDHARTKNFYDGIHLNQEGITICVKNLKEVINPLVDVGSPTENQNAENHRQYNKNQSYNGKGRQQFYQNRPIRNPRNWNPGVDYRYNRYNQTNQYFGGSDYNGSVKRYHNPRSDYNGFVKRYHNPRSDYNGSVKRYHNPRSDYNGSVKRYHNPRSDYNGSVKRYHNPRSDYNGSVKRYHNPRSDYNGSVK